jgi:hypothetical protein
MVEKLSTPDDETLTSVVVDFQGIPKYLVEEFTLREITMVESLLTPGLQTTLKFHNYRHHTPTKDLDLFKGAICNFSIERPIWRKVGLNNAAVMNVQQVTYRLEKRKLINQNVEELHLQLCDQTLLNDARTLVSKSWVCATPSSVVSYVLRNCAGAKAMNIESSGPARDYIAENIHPFQVVTQQADVALAGGNDPSFLHFMTFEDFNGPIGKHHFRSLKKMATQAPILTYVESETSTVGKYSAFGVGADGGLELPVLTFSFPADFDLLQDILNGANGDGNSMVAINILTKMVSLLGNQTVGCGFGGLNSKEALTDLGSPNLIGCNSNVEKYLLKRQARVGLLDEADVALRVTVPWNALLHVGQIIRFKTFNKENQETNYGTGDYLISSLVHNIRAGGYSTITMDCVSETVGRGEL